MYTKLEKISIKNTRTMKIFKEGFSAGLPLIGTDNITNRIMTMMMTSKSTTAWKARIR